MQPKKGSKAQWKDTLNVQKNGVVFGAMGNRSATCQYRPPPEHQSFFFVKLHSYVIFMFFLSIKMFLKQKDSKKNNYFK